MAQYRVALLALLCVGRLVVTQDCSTAEGQLQFLEDNAKSNSDCYEPFIKSLSSDDSFNAKDIEAICKKECVGNVVKFLTSTEKCRNDLTINQMASDLENVICSFQNGSNEPNSSCLFYDFDDEQSAFIGATVESCAGWWVDDQSNTCPGLLPVVNTTVTCEDILKQTYDKVGCCYINYVTTASAIAYNTRAFIQGAMAYGVENLPSDLRVDITDPELLKACGITDAEGCPGVLDDETESAAAVIPVIAPLIVMLFALLSTL